MFNPMPGLSLLQSGTPLLAGNSNLIPHIIPPTNMGIGEANIGQTPRLVFHKPEASKDEESSFHEEVTSRPRAEINQTPNRPDAVAKMLTKEIDSIADKVYRIIEKKITVEKDRRGLI